WQPSSTSGSPQGRCHLSPSPDWPPVPTGSSGPCCFTTSRTAPRCKPWRARPSRRWKKESSALRSASAFRSPRPRLPISRWNRVPLQARPSCCLECYLSSLHADDLLECVHDLNQVLLCSHDGGNVLVSRRRFVDHLLVLTTLHSFRGRFVLGNREELACRGSRHAPSGAVAAALEALRVAEATHDVGARTHASGNDSELTTSRTHRTLTAYQHVLVKVPLPRGVVVMAVHRNLA